MKPITLLGLVLFASVICDAGQPFHIVPSAPQVIIVDGVAMVPLAPFAELCGIRITAGYERVRIQRGNYWMEFNRETSAMVNNQKISLVKAPIFCSIEDVLYYHVISIDNSTSLSLVCDSITPPLTSQISICNMPLVDMVQALNGKCLNDSKAKVYQVHFANPELTLTLPYIDSTVDKRNVEIFNNYQMFSINIDGTGMRRLTNDIIKTPHIALSADGKYLAYERNQNLCIRRIDDPHEKMLFAREPDGYVSYVDLRFSPDGNRLLFTRSHVGASGPTRTQLFSICTDGTGLLEFSPQGQLSGGNMHGCWSPDGKHIVFTHRIDYTDYIYLISSDGKHWRLLGEGDNGRFSPDGKDIYYTNGRIFIYSMQCKSVKRFNLPEQLGSIGGLPGVISPDGTNILLASVNELRVMNLHPRIGSTPVKKHGISLDRRFLLTPDWSRLVFIRNDDLYVLEMDSGFIFRLTIDHMIRDFCISTDGKQVIFTDNVNASFP